MVQASRLRPVTAAGTSHSLAAAPRPGRPSNRPNRHDAKPGARDNLDILRRYVEDESVDLVYLDPPFNSNADYNVLFAEKSGEKAHAQIKAFEDTWEWGLRPVPHPPASTCYDGSRASSSPRAFINGRRVFSEKSNEIPAAENSSGRGRVPPRARAAR